MHTIIPSGPITMALWPLVPDDHHGMIELFLTNGPSMRLSAEIKLLDSTVKWNRSVMSLVQPFVPLICYEIIGSHAMMRHNVMVR